MRSKLLHRMNKRNEADKEKVAVASVPSVFVGHQKQEAKKQEPVKRSTNTTGGLIDPNVQLVEDATTEFATRVITPETTKNRFERAVWIDEMFTIDAQLRPTVGQVIRTKTSGQTTIESYFRDYFSQSNIPSLTITNLNYSVSQLSDTLYQNLAFVKFHSDTGDVTACMSFIFELVEGNFLIKLLHSSPIYKEVPSELVEQGDVFQYWALQKPYGTL